MDPPQQMPFSVSSVGKVTGGLGLLGRGEAKAEAQLVTPRANQNSEALIKISVDNSNCDKMVANFKFNVKRTILAHGYTTQSEKKELKDEQDVMYGKFDD